MSLLRTSLFNCLTIASTVAAASDSRRLLPGFGLSVISSNRPLHRAREREGGLLETQAQQRRERCALKQPARLRTASGRYDRSFSRQHTVRPPSISKRPAAIARSERGLSQEADQAVGRSRLRNHDDPRNPDFPRSDADTRANAGPATAQQHDRRRLSRRGHSRRVQGFPRAAS